MSSWLQVEQTDSVIKNEGSVDSSYIDRRLRWDHTDLQSYYDMTRVGLQPLMDEINCWPILRQFNTIHNNNQAELLIENLYSRIVAVLLHSSRCTVPTVKINVMKLWWDEELSHLKKRLNLY